MSLAGQLCLIHREEWLILVQADPRLQTPPVDPVQWLSQFFQRDHLRLVVGGITPHSIGFHQVIARAPLAGADMLPLEPHLTPPPLPQRRRSSWHRHLWRFPPPPAYLPPRMGMLMMRPLRVGRSYKGSANCTLDSLRFAISTYSGLISIPTACRPRRSATSKVVPLPAKGSRTRHLPLPSLPSQVQVGRSEERRVGKECRCRRAPDP